MGKRKLERFKVIEENTNVVEPSKEFYHDMKGQWNTYFKNENPITIELACGRGEYTLGLAEIFSDRNYIGIDIKGERIWKGSSTALEKNLNNVAFLRTHIIMIENFFAQHEVDEIWITFPDPRPKKRDIKRRLTSPRYLDMYKNLIKPGGMVRFKTDNTALFDYTIEVLQSRSDVKNLVYTHNVYQSELRPECFDIKTKYEQMFAAEGETIKYLRFHF
ncbi:MAG: tRNA (guanosine(46)-N7)-methyltransferase TrmB [Chryseotalea sp.]|jgi:tRNA (guanine-N7-)-methyltransferase|nr:tRNA (guanosine(46)-N7)-methyltransferase TrmB [Flammeovirgaceae bacterium]